VYSYGYSYPSYSYTYQQPDYYNGSYYYHNAGYSGGNYYPAGNYRWTPQGWYSQTNGYSYGNGSSITYSKDWRDRLLDLAAYRDKVEGEIRRQSADQQAFLQAVESLGFTHNFRMQNYGVNPYSPIPYGNGGYVSPNNYGATANTVYGYTYNTIKDVYGDSNLNALFQQSSRLAENAQTLGGQATQGFQENIAREGDNRARVAEILAQAQAAKTALDAAKPQASSRTETTSQLTMQQQGGQQGAAQGQVQDQSGVGQAAPAVGASAAWVGLASNKCASCHSAKAQGGIRGGFDVSQYPQMSPDKKQKVWARILHPDPAKRMPLAADGKSPGTALTADEVRIFVSN
jgi:hypothetical protein